MIVVNLLPYDVPEDKKKEIVKILFPNHTCEAVAAHQGRQGR